MEKYLLKIEAVNTDLPVYREAKMKPLSAYISTVGKMPNFSEESFEEFECRRERIKTHLKEFVGVYVDDQSWEFLNKMMSLSNDNIRLALNTATFRLREDFEFKKKTYYEKVENQRDVIRKFPWYKRLFNLF